MWQLDFSPLQMPVMIKLAAFPEQIQVPLLLRRVRIRQQHPTQIYHTVCLRPHGVSVNFLLRWELEATNTNLLRAMHSKF